MLSRYFNYNKLRNVIIGIVVLVLAIMLGICLTDYSTKEFIFIFLTILGVGVGFLKPKILLFLLFLSLPLETYSTHFLSSNSLFKVVGLYFGCMLFMEFAVTKNIVVPQGSKSYIILIYGIIAIFSLLVSRDFSQSLNALITLSMSIVMYFIIFYAIGDERTLHTAILCLLIAGLMSIVITLITRQGWATRGWMPSGGTSGVSFTRLGGLWSEPNELASYILVLIPLTIVQFLHSKSGFIRGLILGSLAVFLFGFFNTYSRGGYIGFIFLLILSVFKSDYLKKVQIKLRLSLI